MGGAHLKTHYTKVITMWDFSWLDWRLPGAGCEDWDVALRELAERGYLRQFADLIHRPPVDADLHG